MRLVRFATVGLVSTAIDLSLFAWGLAIGMPIFEANLASWLCAASFSYVANARWTFARPWRDIGNPTRYWCFVAGMGVSFTISAAIVLVGANFVPPIIAKAIAITAGIALNFAFARKTLARAGSS